MNNNLVLSILILLSIIGCYFLLSYILEKFLPGLQERFQKRQISSYAIAKRRNNAYIEKDVESVQKSEIDEIFTRLDALSSFRIPYTKRRALLQTAIIWSRKYNYPNKSRQLKLLEKARPFQHDPHFLAELTKYESELYKNSDKNGRRVTKLKPNSLGELTILQAISIILTLVIVSSILFGTRWLDQLHWVIQLILFLGGIYSLYICLTILFPRLRILLRLFISLAICMTCFYGYSYWFHATSITKTLALPQKISLHYHTWLNNNSLYKDTKSCGEVIEIVPEQNVAAEININYDRNIIRLFDQNCNPSPELITLNGINPNSSLNYFISPRDESVLWNYNSTEITVQSNSNIGQVEQGIMYISIENPLWDGIRRIYYYFVVVIGLGIISNLLTDHKKNDSE